MVAGGGVHAVLGEEARPGVGHQPPELVTLLLVGGVVNMSRPLVNQQAGELQQQDPHIVARPERIFRIDDVLDEGGDDVAVVVIVRCWRRTNQFVTLAMLE